MTQKISIIIPNWNGRSLLEKNLPLVLAAAENKANYIGEVIIVDDCSTDESVSFLKKRFKKKIRLVVHKKNRGFSSTVNTGARSAKNQLLCLLNTDVFPEKEFLVSMQSSFKDPKVFAVSLNEKGYGPAVAKFENGFIGHAPGRKTTNITSSFWANGGSGVFRREIWMRLMGMDEKLLSPFYWEDIDLSYRAWKRGYKVLWDPGAHVIHQHESIINSTNFKKYWLNLIKERNQLIFIWKNLTSQNLVKKHIRGLIKRTLSHPGYIKVIFLSLWKLKLILAARKIEKKESILSDEAIFEMFTK